MELLVLVLGLLGQMQQEGQLVLRIGALDGPDALGQVDAIEVDPQGRIYVLESDEHRVRVFTADGEEVGALGRRGGGPGELEGPVGLAWGPEGGLWVIDPGNNRVSVFETTGAHRGERRLPSGVQLAPWPGRFDRQGRFYHYAPAAGSEFGMVMVRYDRALRPLDTLTVPVAPEPEQFFETRTERWGMLRARIPFTPRLLWALGPDGEMWWAWSARYEIFAGARSDAVITGNAAPVAVDPAERQTSLERLARFQRLGGRVTASSIPTRRPPLMNLWVDDGRVWTVVASADGPVLENHRTSGQFVARYRLPVPLETAPRPVVRGDRLYAVTAGEYDEAYVVVIRLPQRPG